MERTGRRYYNCLGVRRGSATEGGTGIPYITNGEEHVPLVEEDGRIPVPRAREEAGRQTGERRSLTSPLFEVASA